MTTTSLKFTQKFFAQAAVLFLLAQVLWLPQMNPAAAQSTPAGPSATDFAPLLSQWSPSQTDNGWWPALSSDGRYVAYGNWGESWVTDLQTGQNWDFRNPPGLDGVHRCIAGQWIKSDTLTFVCEIDVDDTVGFARYEVKVGEWVPQRTSDNPALVLANTFMAKDGHWASYIAGTRIVKDNQVIASQRPGGLMALSENMLVHACNNANVSICVVRDRERIKTYPARTPLFGADMYKNYIAYGGYGPVRGIEPSGLDVDLSAIRGFRESVPKIVGVNNQPWVVTDPWNSASQFMLLRPWGERSSIVVNLQSVSFSVVHTPGKFTIAGNTDRGLLQVVTISDQSRRVDLCGEACRNVPLSPVDGNTDPLANARYADLGGRGGFPDVIWYQNRVWVAYRGFGTIELYSFNSSLQDKRTEKIYNLNTGAGGFPRLTVSDNTLWMAFRDGEASGEDIKLWRLDTDAIESLGPGWGNDPVALGRGYIAWQSCTTGRCNVYTRLLTGGARTYVRSALPTGISRVFSQNSVVMWDTDRTALSWGLDAWFAGNLAVAVDVTPNDDNGIAARFSNDPASEFNIWPNQMAHNPHAATDGNGNYAVVVWQPTIRVVVFHKDVSGNPDGEPGICDETSEDPNEVLQCQIDELENPDGPVYGPGEDPANPVVFPADGQAGVAAAYSAKNDSVLVAAGKLVSDNNRQIVGMMANAKTMEIAGTPFRIDGGTSSGSPKVVYSPDFEKYLVAWEDTRPCGVRCRSAYGRFIAPDGAPIGADFAINPNPAFLSDVAYDATNKKFLVLSDALGASLTLRTVDGEGRISAPVTVSQSFQYQGQAGITYNSKNNEYWIAYAAVVSGNDTAAEDDRIMLARLNAETFQKVGSDVQLNATNPGRNRFSGAHIAYSPQGGAMVIWMEREREGVAGTWGRTVYDDGTLSDEYPVITINSNPLATSEGFSSSGVAYNEWTESFFVSSGDWDGNAWLTEIHLSGSIYDTKLVLSVRAAMTPSFWTKLLKIKTAIAAAVGSFNITSAATPYGAVTLASRNYSSVVGAQYLSANSPSSSGPRNTTHFPADGAGDLTAIPTLISKIYIWSLGIAGLLALLMTVIGGYSYMTAAGNAERAQKGTEMIWGAIIGLALLFGAYLLLNTINPNLTNFSVRSVTSLFPAPLPGAPTTVPAPRPEIPAGVRPYTKQEVIDLIDKYSAQFGVDPRLARNIAGCESSFRWDVKNPAPNSSASGVFQFVRRTWASTPEGASGISVFDADANVRAAVRILKERGTRDWDASKPCWGGNI